MGGPGFAKLGNQLIRENSALKKSLKKSTKKSGKHKDGKKAIKFKQANRATKKIIYYDKVKLQKQLRFRVGLVIVIAIFVFLAFLLFFNFG